MSFLKIENLYKILNLKPLNFYNGEYSLIVIQYFGFWRPSTYSSQWKKLLYSIYSIFMLTFFSFFVCSLLGIFFQGTGNVDVISESCLYFTAIFIIYLKTINIMIQRKKVIRTMKLLSNEISQARSLNESKILQKCSYICRYEKKVKKCITLLLSQHTTVLIFLILFFIFVG